MSLLNKNILIVDDELWFISPIVNLLEYYGFKVDTAQTIAGGVNKNSQKRYGLLILDNMLPIGKLSNKTLNDYFKNNDRDDPGMSFLMALKNPEIKKLLNVNDELKIIFHSVSNLSQTEKKLLKEMGISYFNKCGEERLEQLVKQLLNEKEASS